MQLLQSGTFQVGYQNGFLRQITHEGAEVVRMMYFALRDHNWGTFAQKIEDEIIVSREDSFSISYQSTNVGEVPDPIFEWKVRIEGDKEGTITFEIQGKALCAVRRNRAGFCILHPIQGTAEQPVTIFHEDDSKTTTRFPRYISAPDPFLNIRAMQWQVGNGGGYHLDFEGDIFQTEDQRNWGDASYKTFCTPLSRPFPVQLQEGDTVWQRVTLRPISIPEPSVLTEPEEKSLSIKNKIAIGIAASVETERLSEKAIALLKSLSLSHYRIDLHLSESDWITICSNHCENAALLDLPLEIALFCSEAFEAQLADFAGVCQQNALNIKQLLLFSAKGLVTPQPLIDFIPTFKKQLLNVKIGVGTDYNFTELNRNRFEIGAADFVSCSFHPQEHAFDDLSMMENTETVQYLVESAENLYHKPVHLSFISLKKRTNPYVTNPADFVLPIEKQLDSRQKTDFAKEWATAVLQNLAHTNAVSATLFRTVGALGIMDEEGEEYPVYQALAQK
ncbi:hypothetical protein [Runella slithyformis]|uniref:Uncharacterized protein n=1 Tax=Runella slithyformis (strain ATCC 29530 / DSM 19594 / LMG 11500 / NCIMB 11436 / LSU 4) TaxID=761193 RepID=A0A7U4E809_RUNSL|nr:hypothetical protein [Runella slithyformis]AEI50949.1 hypothetical protein Runsl_4629 [Runella slithyformis DSM 19594]